MNAPRIVTRKKTKGNDTYAIYLQQFLNGKKIRISLGICVHLNFWDKKRRRIKRGMKNASRYNRIIGKAISKAEEILTAYELKGVILDKETFVREYRNPASREDFILFYDDAMHSELQRDVISEGTFKSEKLTLNRLREYKSEIRYCEISVKWLIKFDQWHAKRLKKRGYDGRQQRERSIKHLKKYLTKSKAEGKEFIWPFTGYKSPSYTTKFTFLEEHEVLSIIQMYHNPEAILTWMQKEAEKRGLEGWKKEQYASASGVKRLRKVMQTFIFQCFTGIRYGDLASLKQAIIEQNHICITPKKTKRSSGIIVRIPLTAIVKQYINPPPSENLIPVISNTKYNLYLKEVTNLCNLDKTLKTLVSRHTFATLFLSGGGSLEVLQKLMGHRNIRTTMIYAHVTEDRKQKEMADAFQKFKAVSLS